MRSAWCGWVLLGSTGAAMTGIALVAGAGIAKLLDAGTTLAAVIIVTAVVLTVGGACLVRRRYPHR